MICLAGAISLDILQKLYFFFGTMIKPLPDHKRNTHYLQFSPFITFLAIFVCGILGLSRSFALYRGNRDIKNNFFLIFLILIRLIFFSKRLLCANGSNDGS